jgi:nucleotide-binding universal stress UspA family protein
MGLEVMVVAVDFSEVAAQVYEAAAGLADRLRARVVVVNITEPQVDLVGLAVPQAYTAAEEEIKKLAEAKLNVARELFEARSVQVETVHEWGPVVACILDKVAKYDAGLVVVGSHGHGALYNLLVGSVAEGVIRHSTVPVVVVPGARTKAAPKS